MAAYTVLTRTTPYAAEATQWFSTFEGAGLDGVVAKPLASAYVPNGRVMLKIKHARTADVVVAGYRLHKNSTTERPLLGSMLLGLYADDGTVAARRCAASFPEARRAELIEELAPLVTEFSTTLGASGRTRRPRHPAASRGPEPLDRKKRPVVRSAQARAGGRGRV